VHLARVRVRVRVRVRDMVRIRILRSSLCTSARTRRSCRAAVRSIERLAAVPRITDPLNWPWVYVLGG